MGTRGNKPDGSGEMDSPVVVLMAMFVGPLVLICIVESFGIPVMLAEWAASFF